MSDENEYVFDKDEYDVHLHFTKEELIEFAESINISDYTVSRLFSHMSEKEYDNVSFATSIIHDILDKCNSEKND